MKKRKLALILLLCFFAGGITRIAPFQSFILANDSSGSEEMSEERKREIRSRLEELKRQEELREELRRQRKNQEFRRHIAKFHPEKAKKREPLWIQSDQRRKERKKEREEAGGRRFLHAKDALEAS